MHTETTNIADRNGDRGWVFYDGQCSLCIDLADRFGRSLARRGFGLAPLQTPWVRNRLGLTPRSDLTDMKVLTRDGEVLGGADGAIHLARYLWWAWPLYALARLPGMRRMLRLGYRWIAERRHCLGGACAPRRASK